MLSPESVLMPVWSIRGLRKSEARSAQEFTACPSSKVELADYALTFLLGIYGGFFSGGYVTILTTVYVALFRLSFVEAVATTKLVNFIG